MAKKAVALGNFDGIHSGHIAVLDTALNVAGSELTPFVMLFKEHSEKVLSGMAPPMLMTARERRQFIERYGFGIAEVSFGEIKDMSPAEFVDEILINRMDTGAVVCGFNYRFGKNAVGNADTLKTLCEERGIIFRATQAVEIDGEAVSSTAVRKLIENGEIEKANRMLGRSFGFKSEIIHGDRRGSEWGFPTANQKLPDGLVLPKFGVYACDFTVDGITYKAVTNVGRRPTVGTDVVLCETNIFNFYSDIYGKQADIRLTRFIREERKFNSFDELVEQIRIDANKVKGSETADV